jgi:hypothetical protein
VRELDLFYEHLSKERDRHMRQLYRMASESVTQNDWALLVAEAKAVSMLERMMGDLRELERDTGEFVMKNLQR